MAKKSHIARQAKRKKLVDLKWDKRVALKKTIKDENATVEEKEKAMFALTKLPRDSSPVRLRSRCRLTGRVRGYYRKFGVSRLCFRELALNGQIPGIIKASW